MIGGQDKPNIYGLDTGHNDGGLALLFFFFFFFFFLLVYGYDSVTVVLQRVLQVVLQVGIKGAISR